MSDLLLRMVARLYASLFVSLLGGLLVIYLVADFGEWARIYVGHTLADVARLYGAKAPVAVLQFAPGAMLLAAAASATLLRQRGEWTAMQALGFSHWALLAPVAGCALAAAVALVVFEDRVGVHAGRWVDEILAERFGRGGGPRPNARASWFRIGQTMLHERSGQLANGKLGAVTLLELDADFRISAYTEASAMQPVGEDLWRLEGVSRRQVSPDGEHLAYDAPSAVELRLAGTNPDTFRLQTGLPEQMDFASLREQQTLRTKLGLPAHRLRYTMHARLAWPLTGVAGALLAALLALRPSRRGGLAMALMEGALVSVLLFTLTIAGKAVALGEHLPPELAAWSPVLGLLLVCAAVLFSPSIPQGAHEVRRALKARLRRPTR